MVYLYYIILYVEYIFELLQYDLKELIVSDMKISRDSLILINMQYMLGDMLNVCVWLRNEISENEIPLPQNRTAQWIFLSKWKLESHENVTTTIRVLAYFFFFI